MRLVPSRRLIQKDVSYEFMNRQMVWHAFTVCTFSPASKEFSHIPYRNSCCSSFHSSTPAKCNVEYTASQPPYLPSLTRRSPAVHLTRKHEADIGHCQKTSVLSARNARPSISIPRTLQTYLQTSLNPLCPPLKLTLKLRRRHPILLISHTSRRAGIYTATPASRKK